jgi:tetratricopeptide (TPR) repeat protein
MLAHARFLSPPPVPTAGPIRFLALDRLESQAKSLNRATLILTLAALLAVPWVRAADNNQLDSNIQLYTVMAAINAAGFDAGVDSPLYQAEPNADSPNVARLRLEVRKALAGTNQANKLPVIAELKKVYEQHKPRHSDAEDFSQYASLALSITGPPDFAWKGRQVDIPPDAVALEEFRSLLPDFYAQAGIEDLWRRSQPALEHMIEVYHSPVAKMAFEISSYLRMPLSGNLGRSFQIYVDALGPPNFVQGRAYGDTYYVILSPSLEPRIQDVRHSFLRFTVDPIGTKYGLALMEKRSLLDIAVSAPALPEVYKNDFVLLATESLIKAIEARLDRTAQSVTAALEQGFVLTPFFFEQLPLYEKQPQSLRLNFPDMIEAINLKKETERLQNVKFAAAPSGRLAKAPPPPPAPAPAAKSPAGRLLSDAEDMYDNKDYDKAKPLFLRSLELSEVAGEHARAYYGLARIAALQKDPELSERLFKKALEMSPDPQVKAWSLVYLGKLADISGEPEQARKSFAEALNVQGISKKAREEAEKGLKQISKP